ncbi:hypothetical protein [Psychrobacter sp. I-STPA10]|uniref:hypothetical protein n=1 Tax=Psychrobacter sp. I-STPA10 TaxID=2585769 RepID=UPI001E2CEA39|nr:hypothetical protein [Psychrobacter sp. I-STPA10]
MAKIKTIEGLMDKEGALVINTYPNRKVAISIKNKINSITDKGEHVLILKGYTSKKINEIEIHENIFLDETYITTPFNHGFGYRCSIYDLIDILKDDEYNSWIKKVRLILIESGDDVFYEPNIWETAFYLLQDKLVGLKVQAFPNLLILIKPRNSVEPALKEVLPLYDSKAKNETTLWRETYFNITTDEVKKHWWTIWSSCESDDYRNKLIPNNSGQSIGIIAPLAQFAGRWGIERTNNLAVFTNESGEKDRLENLDENISQVMYKMQDNVSWQFFAKYEKFSGAVTISDNTGNPWLTLKSLAFSFPDLTISNVVAKQTLMLEYFLANAHCFATVPIQPLSPRIKRNSPYNTVLVLLQRLKHSSRLSLVNISYLLSKIDTQNGDSNYYENDIFGQFKYLVGKYFGETVANQLRFTLLNEWDDEKQGYLNKGFVSIDENYLHRSIDWLQSVEVRDGNNHFSTILKDHIYQYYWVGKQVLFFGKVFTVESIDAHNNLINVTHCNDVSLLDYRLDKYITVAQFPAQWTKVRSLSSVTSYKDGKLVIDSYILNFSVHCGNEIICNNSMWKNPSITVKSDYEFVERDYPFGRVLRIKLLNNNNQSLLTDQSAIALSAWLNESIITLLPEIHPFFVSAPQLVDNNNRPKDVVTNICIPELNFSSDGVKRISCVWIFEDSHTDLGIIRTIYDNFQHLLDLCYDWLEWFLVDSKVEVDRRLKQVCLENISYPSSNWFSYGSHVVDDAIDLLGLREAIKNLFGSTHEFKITSRRRRIEKQAEKYKLIDNDTGLIYECDICQKVIAKEETSFVLSDGRISCDECYQVGVTDVAEVKKIYQNLILDFYSSQHEISNFPDLQIQLVDQTKISQQQNTTFIPTSRFDSRAIGLAVSKGILSSATSLSNSKYKVMLESGHSIENTAGTLVHELCHIWQYEYTDYVKLESKYGKHIIEGHAVWAEESFLDYLNEKPYAEFDDERLAHVRVGNDAHKNSDSVYGKGYRLLIAKMGTTDASAFKWVLRFFIKK